MYPMRDVFGTVSMKKIVVHSKMHVTLFAIPRFELVAVDGFGTHSVRGPSILSKQVYLLQHMVVPKPDFVTTVTVPAITNLQYMSCVDAFHSSVSPRGFRT
jgi:hypothetical protein